MKELRNDGGLTISPRLGECFGMSTGLVRAIFKRVTEPAGGPLSHVDPDVLPTYHTLRSFPRERWTGRSSSEDEREVNRRAFDTLTLGARELLAPCMCVYSISTAKDRHQFEKMAARLKVSYASQGEVSKWALERTIQVKRRSFALLPEDIVPPIGRRER